MGYMTSALELLEMPKAEFPPLTVDSKSGFLDEASSLNELVIRCEQPMRDLWLRFGHMQRIPVFENRKLVVYKVISNDAAGIKTAMLDEVTVESLTATFRGTTLVLKNSQGAEHRVTYTPSRLFGHPLIVMVPPVAALNWGGRIHGDTIWRSMVTGMLLKSRNHPKFANVGNVYAVLLNEYRELVGE